MEALCGRPLLAAWDLAIRVMPKLNACCQPSLLQPSPPNLPSGPEYQRAYIPLGCMQDGWVSPFPSPLCRVEVNTRPRLVCKSPLPCTPHLHMSSPRAFAPGKTFLRFLPMQTCPFHSSKLLLSTLFPPYQPFCGHP